MEIQIDVREPFKWLYTDEHLFKVLVYTRGLGKSFAGVDWAISKLLRHPNPNAFAVYYHKTLKEAKLVVDQVMGRYRPLIDSGAIKHNKSTGIYEFLESGKYKKLVLKSYDSKETSRGSHPAIGVFDEAQMIPTDLWGKTLLPMFSSAIEEDKENSGILLIGTPRGMENIFYKSYELGQTENDTYKSKKIDIYNSKYFSDGTIKIMQMSMSELDFRQECMCDFTVNVVAGAVYKDLLDTYRTNNMGDYPYNPEFPVHMSWDLGYSHYTSVWFWQHYKGITRMIDFYETRNQDISKCLTDVLAKHYMWGHCILPHDANHKNIRSSLTIQQMFQNFGLRTTVMPPASVTAGIEACKQILRNLRFDIKNTAVGVKHLEEYAYKITTTAGVDKSKPDQLSPHADASDSFRMMATSQAIWITAWQPRILQSYGYNVL